MNRYLRPGYSFSLKGAEGTFEVLEIIGRGASCAVYRTYFYDPSGIRTEHLLKEYNPKGIELSRDEAGALYPVSPAAAERFKNGLVQFQSGFALQLRLRQECPELTNSTSNIERIYTGNGTKYISMPRFQGKSYSQFQETDLCQLLRHIKAITRIAGLYHAYGFLHLDIKPENIYILPETAESVMLFDFDSVVQKADLSKAASLSCTKTWAAPEQLLPGHRHRICEATDLYAIGRILFYQLMGRHPVREECRSFSTYQYDSSSDLLREVNPQVFALLSEILSHTICTDVSKRYQSAEALMEKLDELLPLADPQAPYLIGNLPPALSSFVGRRGEMADIHRQLQKQGKLFLSGIGGIGKSELAKQYAQQFRQAYDTVVFARCTDTLESMFADDGNIPIVHVSMYTGETLPQYSQRKRTFWKSLCTERTLLIVDNLNDLEDPLLPELLQMNCRVLITTRADASQLGQSQLTVGVLAKPGEIETVFQNACRQELTDEDWSAVREMIRLVDGHTMAVDLLAKQMRAAGLTPGEMLERLKIRGISGSGHEKIRSGKDGDFSRRDAFDHIRVLFQVADLSSDQQLVLMNMSLLPYTGIAKRRMREWCGWEDYEALNQLVEAGWVKEDPTGMISLHPLVAEVAMEKLKEQAEDCGHFLRSVSNFVSEEFAKSAGIQRQKEAEVLDAIARRVLRSEIETRDAANVLDRVPFAIAGFGYLENCIEYRKRALALYERQEGDHRKAVAQELNSLAGLNISKGSYEEAESQSLRALAIRKDLYGENDHTDLAQSYVSLGSIASGKGNLAAAEGYYQQGLQIYQNVYQCPHETIASTLNNLGAVYSSAGKLSQAKQYYQKALEMRMALYQGPQESIADSWMNFGTLHAKNGELQQAETAYRTALDMYRTLYGACHRKIAQALNNLGVLWRSNGKLDEASSHFEQALKIYLELYGEAYPGTLNSYSNLGGLYYSRGDYSKSRQYYQEALDGYRRLYGSRAPAVADTLLNLGAVEQAAGKLPEAEKDLRDAKDLYESLYKGDHPDIAGIYDSLGKLLGEKGALNPAESYLRRAYHIRKNLFGSEHPVTAKSLLNIGALLIKQGDYSGAEHAYQTALGIRIRKFGEHHPETAAVWQRLAGLYIEEESVPKAAACIDRAYPVYLDSYGARHDRVAALLTQKGNLATIAGDYSAAEKVYLQAKDLYESLHGQQDKNVSLVWNNLAILYNKQGRTACSEKAYLQALSIFRTLYGREHPDIAAVLNNLGTLYFGMNDWNRAKTYYEQALEMRRALFGDYNKNTAASWGLLGLVCGELGEFPLAEQYCHQELKTVHELIGDEHIRSAAAFHRMGHVYARQGKRREAEAYLTRALRIRRAILGDSHSDTIKVKEELDKLS